ncbi:hypothetical protein JHK85_026777 [Glycine max]|nr:hypothetical protein JHK85_026777 [Glycine max]
MAKNVRAAMEPLLSTKFGEEVINEFTPQQYQALLALIQHSDKNVLLEAQPLVTNQRSTSQTSSHSPIDPLLGLTEEEKSLNKGNCHLVSTSPLEVYKAYFKQFQEGFKSFLK